MSCDGRIVGIDLWRGTRTRRSGASTTTRDTQPIKRQQPSWCGCHLLARHSVIASCAAGLPCCTYGRTRPFWQSSANHDAMRDHRLHHLMGSKYVCIRSNESLSIRCSTAWACERCSHATFGLAEQGSTNRRKGNKRIRCYPNN
jgi:hypothetical protein